MKNDPIYIVSTEETYHYGQIVYEEGNSGDWVYVVLSGLVEVSRMVNERKYIIEILQAGDVFGVLEYIGRLKRTSTVRSIGMTTLGLIDREFLDREFNQLPAQVRAILESLSLKSENVLESFPEYISRPKPRKQKILPLLFTDGQNTFRAHTSNVNTKGLFIVTEKMLDPGQEVRIKLQVPDVADLLQIMCEVVQVRGKLGHKPEMPAGMTVKFTKISKTDYQVLREYLSLE